MFYRFPPAATNLDLVPHSIPITPWQLHFFWGSAECEWLFVTLGWVRSSTYGGSVPGCIRAENAVGWALDPSAGLPTLRRLELQPERSNHLNTSLCRQLFWGGALTPYEECTCGAVTVLPNTEHARPVLPPRRRTHSVLGEAAPQTRLVSVTARLSWTQEGILLSSRCDKTVN